MPETKAGRRRLRSSYISSILSISLVLFMIGLLGLLVLDARKISDYVKEHIQLTVFLNDNASEVEVSAMQNLFEHSAFVKSAQYVSKQQALDSLKKDLGEDAVSMLESNPLPASIDLKLNASYAHPDSMQKIADEIQKDKIVREVVYQRSEVDKMNANFRTVAIVIILFCALLLFIAIALINNTIRLSLYSKRFIIKSMQLVGATKAFIRRPFIRLSAIHGLYAGIVACVLLSGLLYLVQNKFPELIEMQDVKEIAMLFGGVIIFGMILSAASSLFAVNRYLNVKVDDLYN
jgi:cell division transport system permease protein